MPAEVSFCTNPGEGLGMICALCRGRGFNEDDGGAGEVCWECLGAGMVVRNPLTELMRTEGLTYPEAVEQFYQESNE